MTFKKTPFEYEEIQPMWGSLPERFMPVWNIYTRNFYISSYVCPECGRLMAKTVFPSDYSFQTTDGAKKVPRIFVCGNCQTFHIPSPGYKLSSNNGYYYKAKDYDEFEKLVKELDNAGSTTGRRNTLYNEG
ncbi:hypothetical protein [Fervidobacterium sp. 2310opik-2]|uniref:hypothetical protein n=1 Tax=Fervidobacterium sp. 2310opik-2 TaxID=1755815 RepID=UPI0013E0A3D8|nr:hypothetical protein [Fervidobacterium sp. 2310opik-2]KAF2961048.1 hypothetical protein AS161_03475 [Fervidobacterium sp. 2310opik-2]